MIFNIKVTNNVGFGNEVHFIQKDFKNKDDAEWWCDSHDIDHEFERVSYELIGEVK